MDKKQNKDSQKQEVSLFSKGKIPHVHTKKWFAKRDFEWLESCEDEDMIVSVLTNYIRQGLNPQSRIHYLFNVSFNPIQYAFKINNPYAISFLVKQKFFQYLRRRTRLKTLKLIITANFKIRKETIYLLFSQVHPHDIIHKILLSRAFLEKNNRLKTHSNYRLFLTRFLYFLFPSPSNSHDLESARRKEKSRFQHLPFSLRCLLLVESSINTETKTTLIDEEAKTSNMKKPDPRNNALTLKLCEFLITDPLFTDKLNTLKSVVEQASAKAELGHLYSLCDELKLASKRQEDMQLFPLVSYPQTNTHLGKAGLFSQRPTANKFTENPKTLLAKKSSETLDETFRRMAIS